MTSADIFDHHPELNLALAGPWLMWLLSVVAGWSKVGVLSIKGQSQPQVSSKGD